MNHLATEVFINSAPAPLTQSGVFIARHIGVMSVPSKGDYMVTITLSPNAVRVLRNVRVWGARVFAMLLIGWNISRGLPLHSTPLPAPFVYSASAVLTATIRSNTPAPPAPRVSRAFRPSNTIVCLAQNLYFEGNNEPIEALEAVAATVFNRMHEQPLRRSVCAVVYQPFQYSWTLDAANWARRPPAYFLDLAAQFWKNRDILADEYPVTHFHRVDVHPRWAASLSYVGTFGQHRFYRQES